MEKDLIEQIERLLKADHFCFFCGKREFFCSPMKLLLEFGPSRLRFEKEIWICDSHDPELPPSMRETGGLKWTHSFRIVPRGY